MREPILVAISIAALLVSAALYVATAGDDPALESLAVETLDPGRLEAIGTRLDALDRRVADLDALRSEIESLEKAPPESASRPAAAVAAVARGSTARRTGDSRPLIDRLLEDGEAREQFRGYVKLAIEKARSGRRSEDRRRAQERRREREELSQGPYGSRNYQVNSLAKKLDLDQRQKDFYHDLLVKYDGRRKELFASLRSRYAPALSGKTTDGEASPRTPRKFFVGSPAAIQQGFRAVGEGFEQLSAEFDAEFTPALDARQREAYEQLPDHERGAAPGLPRVNTALDGAGFRLGAEILDGIPGGVAGESGARAIQVRVNGDQTEVIEIELERDGESSAAEKGGER